MNGRTLSLVVGLNEMVEVVASVWLVSCGIGELAREEIGQWGSGRIGPLRALFGLVGRKMPAGKVSGGRRQQWPRWGSSHGEERVEGERY
ncbi:hypothetical protein Tco_0899149 [Tanacetum coccineum]